MKTKIKSKKQQADEATEYLKQVDKGGRDFVHKHRLEEKKQEKIKTDRVANSLQARTQVTYRTRLAAYAQTLLDPLLEWATGWEVNAIPTHGRTIYIYGRAYDTKEGVQLIIKSPKGNVYMRGITMSYEPELDMYAIGVLVEQAENSMDSERGLIYRPKGKGGILLPNGHKKQSN